MRKSSSAILIARFSTLSRVKCKWNNWNREALGVKLGAFLFCAIINSENDFIRWRFQ